MRVLMVGTVKTKGAGGMATHTEEIITHLRKLGVVVEHYKTAPSKSYPRIIDKLLRAYTRTIGLSIRLVRDHRKFDIIHVQSSGPLGGFIPAVVGAFWRKLLNFKFVVTFHYRPNLNFILAHRSLFSFVLAHTDALLVVSKKQKENFLLVFGQHFHSKIFTIPNGFDSRLFRPMDKALARKQLDLPQDKKIILNVANLVPVKGHKYLIEAMERVVKVRNDVVLIIVGDGSLRKDLERHVKKLNLEEHVKLVGAKPHSEIPLWMNAADVFVLPSLSEGNPTVMFEALGVGLPFVGTAVGGVPEIIISEEYGLLCPLADPECIAEKILIALDKDWDKEKIRKYAERFTWENIAKNTIKMYLNISRSITE